MGRDEHISTETFNLKFLGHSHIFHIVPDNFPLPEEGIIGIKFFSKYRRYAMTSEFLILDNIKLPLYEDGEFIPGKTTNVFRIAKTDQNQNVLVLEQENCIEPKPINTIITPPLPVPSPDEKGGEVTRTPT